MLAMTTTLPTNTIETPALFDSLTELPRASKETFELLFKLPKIIKQVPRGESQPVLTLPGYGASDGSMVTMRYFLERIGYRPYSANLGRNFEPNEERIQSVDDACDFREKMVNLLAQRLAEIYKETGKKITLIGWSMGGCYALDLSQQHSQYVDRVITLGTPFGDPRGTAMWNLMRRLNNSNVATEAMDFDRWVNKGIVKTKNIPINVIYSQRDGIVGEKIAQLPEHPSIAHHALDSSHLSFTYNASVYATIAKLLADGRTGKK